MWLFFSNLENGMECSVILDKAKCLNSGEILDWDDLKDLEFEYNILSVNGKQIHLEHCETKEHCTIEIITDLEYGDAFNPKTGENVYHTDILLADIGTKYVLNKYNFTK